MRVCSFIDLATDVQRRDHEVHYSTRFSLARNRKADANALASVTNSPINAAPIVSYSTLVGAYSSTASTFTASSASSVINLSALYMSLTAAFSCLV